MSYGGPCLVNKLRTHCEHAHEFTEENTYIWVDQRGRRHRACRTCNRERPTARSSRKTVAAQQGGTHVR